MLVGVVSDTHGRIEQAERALKRYPIRKLFFLGDFYTDGIKIMQNLGLAGWAVTGNGDRIPGASYREAVVEIEGVRFFLTHGHTLGVKRGTDQLAEYAGAMQAEVALFGHTHCSYLQQQGNCWLMNPGSAAAPRDREDPSIGLIAISPEKVEFSILSVLDNSLINGNVMNRKPRA